jgi:hypothetical protein
VRFLGFKKPQKAQEVDTESIYFSGRYVGKSVLVQPQPETAPIAVDTRSSQGELINMTETYQDCGV